MPIDKLELEPVSPFSNRQPCFQLSHLIVGIRRSLFWSTRLLQKSKGGQKPTTSCWRLHPTDDLHHDHFFKGREGWETSFNLSNRQRWHLSTDAVKLWQCLLHWELNDFVDSQFALVLNWKADLQPTQLFKGTCALWSAVSSPQSRISKQPLAQKMSFWKQDVYCEKQFCSFTCIYRSVVGC